MTSRRRMLEDSEDAWTSAYEDAHGGSVDDIFSGRDSIFSNEKQDTDNPVLLHNEENAGENPTEGAVQWKVVDGHPVPVAAAQPTGTPAALRKTLVAVEGPTGVLVARAIRNIKTGKVQHLEPMRLPTKAELAEVQQRAVPVPPPASLGDVSQAAAAVTPSPSSTTAGQIPWTKVAVGVGVVTAAWWAWKKWGQ